jgi:predicted dehydrogenase
MYRPIRMTHKQELDMSKTRWGIMGTGGICHSFATCLPDAENAELVAVGSRTQEKADAFGDEFGIPNRHGSYEAFVADPEIDAVYIGSPHHMHRDHTIMCLEAGKAVLCEKPFAINSTEAREMVECARKNNVFLMEAMWTRFLPALVKLRELIAEGVIGELRMVMSDFGFQAQCDPESRLFAPEMGGGGLMDVGVYSVSLANMLLGQAIEIASLMEPAATGVDGQAGVVMKHVKGMSVIATGVETNTPVISHIIGTEGTLVIDNPWFAAESLTLIKGDEHTKIEMPKVGGGYNHQAVAVGEALAAGKTECDVMSLDESIMIMETLDAIRAQWDLKYPMEK